MVGSNKNHKLNCKCPFCNYTTRVNQGFKKGHPYGKRFIKGTHYNQKENHPNWKGGKYIDPWGYVHVLINNKYIREHHYIWLRDNSWGMWFIPEGWCIHHKDGNKQNNHISNLVSLPHGFHTTIHKLQKVGICQ